jgi:molybdopterin-guanine dinucleotide biosynthesis protein A
MSATIFQTPTILACKEVIAPVIHDSRGPLDWIDRGRRLQTLTQAHKGAHLAAGFILAGGASSRMGRDKGLLDFGGIPLMLHTARLLESLVTEVTVVGSPHRYGALRLRAIADENDEQTAGGTDDPGRGPLAGIAAALAATHSRWNVIVACDLPYLSTEWLDWLISRALRSREEAVIPRTEGGIEPLAAVYRRECGVPIAAALARGVRRVSDAIEELRLDLVYPREWRRIDPSGLVLRNMNAPGDYEEARNWWAAERPNAKKRIRKPRPVPKRKRRSVPRRRK